MNLISSHYHYSFFVLHKKYHGSSLKWTCSYSTNGYFCKNEINVCQYWGKLEKTHLGKINFRWQSKKTSFFTFYHFFLLRCRIYWVWIYELLKSNYRTYFGFRSCFFPRRKECDVRGWGGGRFGPDGKKVKCVSFAKAWTYAATTEMCNK